MLKFNLVVCAFLISGVACAHEKSNLDCPYADQVERKVEFSAPGKVVREYTGLDEDSREYVIKREVDLENGDSVHIEQKYCSVYNLTVTYFLNEVNEASFERGLNVIYSVIKGANQDYRLKSPLRDIVDMTMNQRGLTLNEPFEYGLPLRAAHSSDYVEHVISFVPRPDGSEFAAKIRFYVGIGGL